MFSLLKKALVRNRKARERDLFAGYIGLKRRIKDDPFGVLYGAFLLVMIYWLFQGPVKTCARWQAQEGIRRKVDEFMEMDEDEEWEAEEEEGLEEPESEIPDEGSGGRGNGWIPGGWDKMCRT
ncbi:hypothetical protein JW906_07675 [bacterium]|nr:hypothetical protein [bacterium]